MKISFGWATNVACYAGYMWCMFNRKMAGVTGLEPATSGVTGQRSNQLSYTPAIGVEHGVIHPAHTSQSHH
jgi:hypothetical protein